MENLFIVLGLPFDPPENDINKIDEAIATKRAQWSHDQQTSILKKAEASEYLENLENIKEIMHDPKKRKEEAEEAKKIRDSEIKELEDMLDLYGANHEELSKDYLKRLVRKYGKYRISEDEIVKKFRAGKEAEEQIELSEILDKVQATRIQNNMQRLGMKDKTLYDFLKLPSTSSCETLLAAADTLASNINQMAIKTGLDDVRQDLCRLCAIIFKDASSRKKYDNYVYITRYPGVNEAADEMAAANNRHIEPRVRDGLANMAVEQYELSVSAAMFYVTCYCEYMGYCLDENTIAAIMNDVQEKRFYAARTKINQAKANGLDVDPAVVNSVTTAIEEVENGLVQLRRMSGDAAFSMAVNLKNRIADSEELNREMERFSPAEVPEISGSQVGNEIALTWKASPSIGEVSYVLVRKENTYANDPADGTVIYSGKETRFTDHNPPKNRTLCYSIYSVRLGVYSRATRLKESMAIIEGVKNLKSVCDDAEVTLSWTIESNSAQIRLAKYRGNDRPKSDGAYEGIPCTRLDGTTIKNLINGEKYWFSVSVGQMLNGKMFFSEPAYILAIPQKPFAPAVTDVSYEIHASATEMYVNFTWPHNVEHSLLVYRRDAYPDGLNDPLADKIECSKRQYESKGGVLITNPVSGIYYVEIYTYVETGERRVYSEACRAMLSNEPPQNVRYTLKYKKKSLFNKTCTLTIEVETEKKCVFPAFAIISKYGSTPLKRSDGDVVCTVKDATEIERRHTFELEVSPIREGTRLKMFFLDEKNYKSFVISCKSGSNI